MTKQPMPIEAHPGSPSTAPDSDRERSGDDAFWVMKARKGDAEAFGELVELHGRSLYRLAYRITRREDLADDVVQESFFKAYKSLDRFDGRSRFSTWLHRIAVNCALDLLRRQKGQEVQLGDSFGEGATDDAEARHEVVEPTADRPSPERLALSAEIEASIERALESLTPTERAAFVLRHFEHCSIAEIGRSMGSRTSATKQSIFRAVRKLRQHLSPLFEDPGSVIAFEKGHSHADPD